jgi:hypothetical protein
LCRIYAVPVPTRYSRGSICCPTRHFRAPQWRCTYSAWQQQLSYVCAEIYIKSSSSRRMITSRRREYPRQAPGEALSAREEMEFCARQQLLLNLSPPPTTTKRRRPLPAPSSSTAAWARPRQPAAGLLCRSSRRPSRLALRVTAPTTTNAARRPSEVTCLDNIIRDTKLPRCMHACSCSPGAGSWVFTSLIFCINPV